MAWGFGFSVRTKRRPSPEGETYRPKLTRGAESDEPVPERFRNVRLRRKRFAKMQRTPVIIQIAIAAAAIGFVLVVIQRFGS